MTRLRAQLFLQVGQKGLALNNNDGWQPPGTRRTKSHLILSTVPCFRYGCSHFTNMETKAQKDGWPRGARSAVSWRSLNLSCLCLWALCLFLFSLSLSPATALRTVGACCQDERGNTKPKFTYDPAYFKGTRHPVESASPWGQAGVQRGAGL